MRESIGGAWILGLMVTFILLFTAFIIITMNYTRAFRVKNEILDFIEREEGLTSRTSSSDEGAIQLIANYLTGTNQLTMGRCEAGSIGAFALQGGSTTERVTDTKKLYYYCVQKYNNFDSKEPQKAYYNITIFFDFNIPVFGDIFKFPVNGNTANIQYPADCLVWTGDNCRYTPGSGSPTTPSITKYTVSFNSNGGSSIASQTINSGNYASKPTNPTRSGYTFVEWRLNSASGSVYYFNSIVTSNITLVAVWKANTTSTIPAGSLSPSECTSRGYTDTCAWSGNTRKYCTPGSSGGWVDTCDSTTTKPTSNMAASFAGISAIYRYDYFPIGGTYPLAKNCYYIVLNNPSQIDTIASWQFDVRGITTSGQQDNGGYYRVLTVSNHGTYASLCVPGFREVNGRGGSGIITFTDGSRGS